jgi:hypothetical protein
LLLDALRACRIRGRFPHNHHHPEGRRRPVPVARSYTARAGHSPIFVDEHGTPCAVGYLIHVTGRDDLINAILEAGGQPLYLHEIAALDIEGLSADASHPLQKAWQEIDVPQCGYCQAGQLMSAAALLRRTPRPTDADIDTAMSANLCRCATYNRIRTAIHRAAAIAQSTPSGRSGGSNE